MAVYLLLILPTLIATLSADRLTTQKLILLWLGTVVLMSWLMPIGSRDYATYLRDFADFNETPFLEVMQQDLLYRAAVWIFGHLGGTAEAFYLLLASLGLVVKLTALQRLTGRSSLAILIYISSYFFLHDFTQLRAGLAIGIWMHALADLPYSRSRYLLLTILASLVHLQAAVGFVLYVVLTLARSEIGFWSLIVSAILIVLSAATSVFEQLGYTVLAAIPDPRTEIYIAMAAEDIWVKPNPYSFISMLALLTALTGAVLERYHALQVKTNISTERAVYTSLLLGACSVPVLSSIPVAAFRVSEHFFSLLPVGLWMLATRERSTPRCKGLLWMVAVIFAYIFVFYSPYLLEPNLGE